MLIVIIVLVAIAAGFIAGGSLRGFEQVRIHWWGVALAALVVQGAVPSFSLGGRSMGPVLLAISYVMLVVFAWVNRRLPAAPLMVIGLILNLLVVVPNGGMPVGVGALETAGGPVAVLSPMNDGKHHLMTEDDVLRPLADVIAIPSPVGAVFSIGDVFLYVGLISFIVLIMLGRSGENRRPPARHFQGYRGKHLPPDQRLPRRSEARSPLPAVAKPRGSEP